MTLWSVYHTLFGVFATSTVSYITPMVWYPHFIFYSVISRQEEIIGLVKPLLPKSTMKPRVIHITVILLVSLRITCVYSTNAIIVLFKVSC